MPEPPDYLRLLERVAAAANESSSIDEAAATVLAEVCAETGWLLGHLHVAGGGDPPTLRLTATWGATKPDRFRMLPQVDQAAPPAGEAGLPARIQATGRPAWVTDIRPEPNLPPDEHGRRAGLGAAFGFPVLVGGEVAAVLEFFAAEAAPPDPALLEVMAAVGERLARVVERTRAMAALRQSEERYRTMTESAREAIVAADLDGTILSFNKGAERAFGYASHEVVGQALTVLMPERFHEAHTSALAGRRHATDEVSRTLEVAGLRRDGSEFPLEVSVSVCATAGGRFYAAILRDLSDRPPAPSQRPADERQLAQRALHDPLTGLPNRALLADRLEHAIARAERRGSLVAVACLDLDRFKLVNDGYGHDAGDELLVALAARLQVAVRPDDTVARLGGDEFAVLGEEVNGREEAADLAERLQRAVVAPFVVGDQEVTLTSTVGVALAPGLTSDPDQLLRNAEVALEQARQWGSGQHALYEESMRADVAEPLALEHDLRVAVREKQLSLVYQPIVELWSGQIVGVEALVRWEHPTRGPLLPQQFVALAEETGLIVPLGRWVLEQACLQGGTWQRRLPPAQRLRMSVNVSARQFQRPDWAADVGSALRASGLDPRQLVLEITESVLMDDTDTTGLRLAELRALGVRIAIDDFGTGYSSLGYLRRFPVDILKVDKSFIDGVAEGPHESALARAVIKLAATLKMDAVAEGVSNKRQVTTLRRLRCRFAQGYYFARPQPAEAIDALLARPVLVGEDVNGAGKQALDPETVPGS